MGKGPPRGLEGSGTQQAVGRRWQAAGARKGPAARRGLSVKALLALGGVGAGRGQGGGARSAQGPRGPRNRSGLQARGQNPRWGAGVRGLSAPARQQPSAPRGPHPPPATPLPHAPAHSRFCSARGRCAVVKARKDSLPMSQSSKPGTWPWRLAQRSRCWSFRSTFRESGGRPAGGGRLGDTEAEASHHFLKAPGSDPVSWRQLRCGESPI